MTAVEPAACRPGTLLKIAPESEELFFDIRITRQLQPGQGQR
jgi:hypothetical protein